MGDSRRLELADFGQRLARLGLSFREAPYFGPTGLLVFAPQPPATVLERTVFVYPRHTQWEARVTVHGGPHWTRTARDLSELEALVLEALGTSATPPSAAWTSDDEA